jgi:Ca2+-binding RTX toxin-like protein
VNDVHDVVQEGSNAGRDTVISSANFFLGGNVENLTLTGNATLGRGNDLDNAIVGNARNDNLTGYGGADTLTGGAGQDTFVYTALGDSSATAYDTILDFNPGQRDKLDLRQVDARDNVPYNQAFRWIGSAAFDPDGNNAGLLRFDPVTHMLEGSTNADANVEFRILLVGVDHLSMANILL